MSMTLKKNKNKIFYWANSELNNDGDGILNPGESATLHLSAHVQSAPSNAENVGGTLTSNFDWVHFGTGYAKENKKNERRR